ncbi:MAG: hypothetical protein ACRD2X_12770 [Vicinamibacteraceae bacterium]
MPPINRRQFLAVSAATAGGTLISGRTRAAAPGIAVQVGSDVIGHGMPLVGFNTGHFMPRGNTAAWIEYAHVNAVRFFASLSIWCPDTAFDGGAGIETIDDFDARKAQLRDQSAAFIDWKALRKVWSEHIYETTNHYNQVKSQGWTPLIIDTNGNGKRDEYVEPDQPLDASKDKRFDGGFYAVSPAPDGLVWGSVLGFPGAVIRLNPGANPPETALAEVYEPPWDNPNARVQGFSPRGMDVDRNGVVWVPLASGHLASFDRRKCRGPLNGPKATGQHCPEGWTLYPEPLPQLQGVTHSGSAEASYYTWVDQFDTLGLGKNTPINTGNASEGLLALKDGKWVVLRVPYPLGFYTKWMDGRIDDPSGGWKGRGLWATVSTRAPFHMEGGKGTTSKVLKFQLRPDPLAN